MDKKIHAIITAKPEKRHLLKDVGNLVVNEFGETVVLLEYSTTGFWLWKRVTLEFEVVEDAHYLCHDSVVLLNNAIMDRDGDIRVSTFELEDVTEEAEGGCCCCTNETECEEQQPDTGEVEVEEADKEDPESVTDEQEGETQGATPEGENTDKEDEDDEFAGLRSPGYYMSP